MENKKDMERMYIVAREQSSYKDAALFLASAFDEYRKTQNYRQEQTKASNKNSKYNYWIYLEDAIKYVKIFDIEHIKKIIQKMENRNFLPFYATQKKILYRNSIMAVEKPNSRICSNRTTAAKLDTSQSIKIDFKTSYCPWPKHSNFPNMITSPKDINSEMIQESVKNYKKNNISTNRF
ncbi:MAG: hypothetical protein LBI37_02990 [Puniceicoccales bacterium]|nr:hypothetical protein [Puniceicoccales bacterium]